MALETPVVDLVYKRGDSRPIPFVLKNSDGTLRDLTGWTLPVLAVDTEPEPEGNVDPSPTEVFQTAGTIDIPTATITFAPATDATGSDQEPGIYFYDAQALDAAGKKTTFVEGRFEIKQDRAKA